MDQLELDQHFMREAMKQARFASEEDEVPVGAVIVRAGILIAKARNQVEVLGDPTAHAEIIAITQATHALGHKWLQDCCCYVTIEPCSMCAGALVLARIARLVFGACDPKAGACGSVLNIAESPMLNHAIDVHRGLLGRECGQLVSGFFEGKRRLGKG